MWLWVFILFIPSTFSNRNDPIQSHTPDAPIALNTFSSMVNCDMFYPRETKLFYSMVNYVISWKEVCRSIMTLL